MDGSFYINVPRIQVSDPKTGSVALGAWYLVDMATKIIDAGKETK